MPDDIDDHVAFEFHGLVSDLQRNDVSRFEDEQKRQARERAALRLAARQHPNQGLSAGELLKQMDGGDPEIANRKVQDELDRIDRDARAAADKQRLAREPMPEGNFPPPPDSE